MNILLNQRYQSPSVFLLILNSLLRALSRISCRVGLLDTELVVIGKLLENMLKGVVDSSFLGILWSINVATAALINGVVGSGCRDEEASFWE